MIATRYKSTELELVHWLLLILVAIAVLLAFATSLASADPISVPRLLPRDTIAHAKPIRADRDRPFFPELQPGRILPPSEATARLWMTLESQRAGCVAEALAGWEQIRFPDETVHWREVGIAAAYLLASDQPRAELHLNVARQLAPNNALVAYFTGLLRLEQAAAVGRVPDGIRNRNDLLASYTPADDKGQYQTMAIVELRSAIALAGEIRLDERLLSIDREFEETVIVPRVGDLLVALSAENFIGKAHHLLFGLNLGLNKLTDAEYDLDQAAACGIAVLYGYRDLAEAYLHDERSGDAVRAAMKELDFNHPCLRPQCEWLTEMIRNSAHAVWVW